MEKIKVKILGISFAHREGMNTAWLVQYALKAAKKFGRRISQVADIETEFIDLAAKDKKITPCLGCGHRWEMSERGCIIKNDYMTKELIPKLAEADGFIWGVPTFSVTVTSKFKIFVERATAAIWKGYLTGKPCVAITVATLPLGGQETCLADINRTIGACEMVPVSWLLGVPGISGPPYGPNPTDDDDTVIGVKKDMYCQWFAVLNGRRLAEFAVMLKLVKRELGELYTREFIQLYHPHYVHDRSWDWHHLDKEDEEFMQSIETPKARKKRLAAAKNTNKKQYD
jgi:multimeric flavodoxin WrbA